MLPGKKYTPEDVVRILMKHKWLLVAPFVLGLGAGVFAFRHIPKQYRSETLIMVVPQRIPDTYVKPTITSPVEDRLTTINDQIMSRSRLERIIHDFDLYKEARATGIMEDVVQRMRRDIKPTIDGKDSMTFRVTYVNRDPKTAQKVTERLASLYIEENLRDRESLAENTNQFLESQLEDAKRRLLEHEKKLEEYRRLHAGQLPTQLQTNLQAIQNAQLQLQAVSESINRTRERHLLLERQLADAQTLPLPVTPGNPATPEATPSAAQQLENAQARLDLYKLRYTADHPDVKTLERTISELQVKVQEEAKRPPTTAPDKPLTPAEVAKQKRIKDLEADIEVLNRQTTTSLAEEARLKKVISDYQAKVDVLPSRESDLVELMRDYGGLQETYASLQKKREDSKLAADLQRRQIGEQFKVLDPASLPERPYNQNQRLMALAGGAFGGLALGLVLVGFLEYRDSSFKSEEDVLRVLTLPVLALVPVMMSEDDRQATRRRKRRYAVALTAVVVLVSAAAVLWRLQS